MENEGLTPNGLLLLQMLGEPTSVKEAFYVDFHDCCADIFLYTCNQ
jgi:hypothetical protein